MKRAKFTYQLVEYKDRLCIIIKDEKGLMEPCRSVASDIANVINQIEDIEGIRAENYVIVFRDVAKNFHGWDARRQQSFNLQKWDWPSAVQKFIYLQLEHETQHS